MTERSEEKVSSNNIPTEFKKITKDFVKDILTTFPEYIPKLDNDLKNIGLKEKCDESVSIVYDYCKGIIPERFFDILYQNEEIFSDLEINTTFLPGIDFKYLWSCDISDKTKETIWKYLQLLLFSSVGNLKDGESFGETAKLFEAIDENEFKSKLSDVMSSIQDIFNKKENIFEDEDQDEKIGENEKEDDNNEKSSESNFNFRNVFENMPNPETLHDHISSMLDGKLGKLATEIAEETAGELDIDFSGSTNAEDVMKKLFKNPTKLMDLVKKVGGKLDSKLKSGQIDEKELMSEASELMRKMKDMPGMENMEEMLKGMNIPGMGKKAKFNMNAYKNQMNKMNAREKAIEKAKENREKKEQENKKIEEEKIARAKDYKPLTEEEMDEIDKDLKFASFSTGEKVEKSMRPNNTNNKKKKKKKNKK